MNIPTDLELALDEINDIPIIVSFCPFCNSSVVVDRRVINGNKIETLEFGVSGLLRKSDMVMWDLDTGGGWEPLTTDGFFCALTGKSFKVIAVQMLIGRRVFLSLPG